MFFCKRRACVEKWDISTRKTELLFLITNKLQSMHFELIYRSALLYYLLLTHYYLLASYLTLLYENPKMCKVISLYTFRYRKSVEQNKNDLLFVTQCYCLLHSAISFDPTIRTSSGKEKNWGHEMYMEVPYGIPFGLHRSLYLSLYPYLYIK
jgi:hypothetical protein